ncbi:MAG TPA: CHASE3 domain-containing protein [Flavobacterium sp.]|nr:CHASE3 domain-containing protein [Flavobacterium sp.]
MRKFSLLTKIDLSFAVGGVLFVSLFYAIFATARTVQQNRSTIMETNEICTVLDKILTSTVSIETSSRGYTITGQEKFLNLYRLGNRDLEILVDSLHDLSQSIHGDVHEVEELKQMIGEKQRISASIVEARRLVGEDAATTIIASGRGKELMDKIRMFIIKYQREQQQQLSRRLDEIDHNVRIRDSLFAIFVICTFGLVVFGYLQIRRTTVQTVRSIHMQRKMTHKMAMQNRQLNDFANITSHNLRSPAANISSLVDIVNENSTIDDYRTVFEMLKKVSVNLNETLNELIDVLHIKNNTGIEREQVALSDMCRHVCATLQGQILEKGAEITSDFERAPVIRFPKIYAESILQNLVSNALKYSHPDRKPVIEIRTEKLTHYVKLTVKDNGLGIDLSKYGHKIFGMRQIFHRNADAKGIGLFMTKTQVEALGGKITVESDGQSGTTFIVHFPL